MLSNQGVTLVPKLHKSETADETNFEAVDISEQEPLTTEMMDAIYKIMCCHSFHICAKKCYLHSKLPYAVELRPDSHTEQQQIYSGSRDL